MKEAYFFKRKFRFVRLLHSSITSKDWFTLKSLWFHQNLFQRLISVKIVFVQLRLIYNRVSLTWKKNDYQHFTLQPKRIILKQGMAKNATCKRMMFQVFHLSVLIVNVYPLLFEVWTSMKYNLPKICTPVTKI